MDPAGRLMTQLPEKVMMALVNTPSMFAVPTCINKGFLPPFQVRRQATSSFTNHLFGACPTKFCMVGRVESRCKEHLDSSRPCTLHGILRHAWESLVGLARESSVLTVSCPVLFCLTSVVFTVCA
jgi:hypothetical protein